MPNIMTEDAAAIVRKLERDSSASADRPRFRVEVKEGRSHAIVKLWFADRHIGQFGIQRSSSSKRHNYVAEQLHLSRLDAYRLAKCPLDVDGYLAILEEKGQV